MRDASSDAPTRETITQVVDQCLRRLKRLVPCAVILVTWEDEDTTCYTWRSTGNAFTRRGLMDYWRATFELPEIEEDDDEDEARR